MKVIGMSGKSKKHFLHYLEGVLSNSIRSFIATS